MNYKTRAISLTYIKHGGSSIISKIFTEEKGLQTFIVKGIRSKNSKKKLSYFEPLKLLNLDASFVKKKSFQNIVDITIAKNFDSAKVKTYKNLLAFFLAELNAKILQEEEQNTALFGFIWNATIKLYSSKKPHPNFPIKYLLNLSKFLGFYPSLTEINKPFFNLESGSFSTENTKETSLDQQNSNYLRDLLKNTMPAIPKKNKSKLLKKIMQYYKLHHYNLDNIKSHLVVETLSS